MATKFDPKAYAAAVQADEHDELYPRDVAHATKVDSLENKALRRRMSERTDQLVAECPHLKHASGTRRQRAHRRAHALGDVVHMLDGSGAIRCVLKEHIAARLAIGWVEEAS